MNVLIVAYGYDETDVSESYNSFILTKAISEFAKVTIVTKDSTKGEGVINIPTSKLFRKSRYFRAIKPDYLEFILKAHAFAQNNISCFDLIHQISPISIRYPNPMVNLGKPFIWGPVGGSIPIPRELSYIQKKEKGIYKLKKVDQIRLRFDPLMINTLKRSKYIITTSTACKKIFPSAFHEKCIVIPECIDLKKLGEHAIEEKDFIFSSGRLVPYKAFDLLINAFASGNFDKTTRLLITGSGEEFQNLTVLIRKLKLEGRVELLGNVPKEENLRLMAQSKFCVFPAVNEAFGHVNIEAMALSKPIIVTGNGGPEDIVVDEITGFKIKPDFPPDFIKALAHKMKRLDSDHELRRRMAASAKERVWENYTPAKIAEQIKNLYEKVIMG